MIEPTSQPKVLKEHIWRDGKGRLRVTRELEHKVEVRIPITKFNKPMEEPK